jgi:hypothetical protein
MSSIERILYQSTMLRKGKDLLQQFGLEISPRLVSEGEILKEKSAERMAEILSCVLISRLVGSLPATSPVGSLRDFASRT